MAAKKKVTLCVDAEVMRAARGSGRSAAVTRTAGASGLGLAITKALTEAMSGQMWAMSLGPGLGSAVGPQLPATA